MVTLVFGRLGRCSVRCRSTRATIAIGRPTKKFQRQPRVSVMTPPSSGPPTVATAMTAPKRPAYLPRSRGLMMSAITIWLSAARPPAPMPWNTRIVMSVPVSCENPATAEATTKMTRASCSSSLRLKRSASLPQIGRRDGGGEQGRGDDPGEGGLVALEVGDDERQRRADDRRGEHRHEHAEQEAGEGGEHLAVRHAVVGELGGCGGIRRRACATCAERWPCDSRKLID